MRVIDFIDFSSVTSVLNKNPTMQHLFLSVTDPEGNMLSSAGWKRVCKQFHRADKITCENCRQSDIVLANRFRDNEKYTVYSCYNNLTEASVPFFAAGENIGNLIVGQVFLSAPDLDMFARQAENNGFDKENI